MLSRVSGNVGDDGVKEEEEDGNKRIGNEKRIVTESRNFTCFVPESYQLIAELSLLLLLKLRIFWKKMSTYANGMVRLMPEISIQ